MKTCIKTLALLALLAAAPLVQADSYSEAIENFKRAGESARYFDSAYGYAIFPTIGKIAYVLGAGHGNGRVFVANQYVGASSMTQLSVGWQLGAKAFSQIIFFENEDAFKKFTDGNFEFGAEVTAVAVTAGVSAEATTGGGLSAGASGGQSNAVTSHAGYSDGMAVFTIAKGGLMFEIILDGQKFSYVPVKVDSQATPATPLTPVAP